MVICLPGNLQSLTRYAAAAMDASPPPTRYAFLSPYSRLFITASSIADILASSCSLRLSRIFLTATPAAAPTAAAARAFFMFLFIAIPSFLLIYRFSDIQE